MFKILAIYVNLHLIEVDIDNSICEYVLSKLKNEYPNDYEILFFNNINITVRNYNMIKLKYFSEQKRSISSYPIVLLFHFLQSMMM